jgi:uncharacterized protein
MKYLYLHGFASSARSTKARFFAERFDHLGIPLNILDMAPDGFEKLTISAQLDVVRRTADGAPTTLIGSSMGGYVAALAASRDTAIEKLVLLAPAFGFGRRWPETLGPEAMAEWRTTGTRRVFHYGEGGERNLGYQLIEDAAQYEEFPDFHQPGLILHGRQDTVVPVEYSEQFTARHQNCKLVILESGHEMTGVLERIWTEASRFLVLESSSGNYRIS